MRLLKLACITALPALAAPPGNPDSQGFMPIAPIDKDKVVPTAPLKFDHDHATRIVLYPTLIGADAIVQDSNRATATATHVIVNGVEQIPTSIATAGSTGAGGIAAANPDEGLFIDDGASSLPAFIIEESVTSTAIPHTFTIHDDPPTALPTIPISFSGRPDPSPTDTPLWTIFKPHVIEADHPRIHNDPIVILPFHFTLTETCMDKTVKAKGKYTNGNMFLDMEFPPGLVNGVAHRVHGFPIFNIGPYDYSASRLEFSYPQDIDGGKEGCVWYDDQTWKLCGECRAALWSGEKLDCEKGGQRTKEMDCSFILGEMRIMYTPGVEEEVATWIVRQ